MAQDVQKSRIKELLTRIFKQGDEVESASFSTEQAALEDSAKKEEAFQDEISTEEEIFPAVQTIAERIAVLKKTFEFEPDLKARLLEISSTRDLLLFLHDAILFRFGKLREIGIIGPESFDVIDSLNEKLGNILTQDVSLLIDEVDSANAEDLRKENQELKERIEVLHNKYVKTGIVTETELEQEKEIRFLQSKVREQHSQLAIARKRLKVLASYQDMVQSLRAKNSLLNSKIEHQARLLRTLAANNPKQQQELFSTVESLEEENQRLRIELEKQTELLERLKIHLPDSHRKTAEELITKNVSLHVDIKNRDAQLKNVDSSVHSGEGLLDNIERLNAANTQLKNSIGATQAIERYIQEHKTGTGDSGKVIEILQMENKRLELALNAKEEQVQALTADPASRQLLRAYSNLQNEYKELYMENKARGQLYQQELDQRKSLMAQARERTALIRENQRLQTELESSKRLANALRKIESQYQFLKKDHSEINVKYERALADLDLVNKKLAKVSAQYGLLVKEYENIFNVK